MKLQIPVTLAALFGILFFSPVAFADDICSQVRGGLQISTSQAIPKIFLDIKDIYILPSPDGYGKGANLLKDSILNPESIGRLAQCTIEKHLGTASLSKMRTHVFLDPVVPTEILNNQNNLFISISTGLRMVGDYSGLLGSDVVFVQVNFTRAAVSGKDVRDTLCGEAFSYTDDQKKLLSMATEAMARCLKKPYSPIKHNFSQE